jgi:hypothetical protein
MQQERRLYQISVSSSAFTVGVKETNRIINTARIGAAPDEFQDFASLQVISSSTGAATTKRQKKSKNGACKNASPISG